MAPNPLFYHLLVVALVLICLLIHVGLPDKSPAMPQPPPASTKRRRTRSQDPKPFPGLIHKPLCEALCAGDRCPPHRAGLPTSCPPLHPRTSAHRQSQSHFRPDPDCAYHGWLGRGNIRANGHESRDCVLNWRPWVRSLSQTPCPSMYSPGVIVAAEPTTVTRSRWPRTLTRRTQNPVSSL